MYYTCPMHPEVRKDGPGDCPKCGMSLEPEAPAAQPASHAAGRAEDSLETPLAVAVAFTVPVVIMAMGHLGYRIAQGILAAPVVFWSGRIFFRRAWQSLRARSLNMFTLIAIGVSASYFYSIAALFLHKDIYFETACVITTLVLVGQFLEERARRRTGQAIHALMELSPRTARLVRASGEEEVPIEHIHKGDLLRVRPAEKVPVDGVVVEGDSPVDESMISGEYMPVYKGAGDLLIAGTVNQTGSLLMRAQKVGSETMLAQIIRLVSEAQRSRAPIQRLADRVSAVFVPAVVVAAAAAFAVWIKIGPEPRFGFALASAISVLIVACPCALGLATPMSIMVGIGRAARSGILIRDAEAIEKAERVTCVLVDKTGTLTQGKPAVMSVEPAMGIDPRKLLEVAGSLENASEHPLAKAIAGYAQRRDMVFGQKKEIPGDSVIRPVRNFVSVSGAGVTGRIDGTLYRVGKESFLSSSGIRVSEDLKIRAEHLRQSGQTVVWVADEKNAIGLIGITDPIKESSPAAIEQLHVMGLRVVMLTGDNETTARAVAARLNIDEVRAGLEPQAKQVIIRELNSRGEKTLMIGDGINDGPALAEAHVGVAMGTGTDVAIESAGITLVHGDLIGIVRSLKLSRFVMRNIRQNLFFAFIYNIVCIPIAAGALYPFFGLLLNPMIAAGAMSFSSVSVIGNALRLRKLRL